ncbi:MAG: peptide deformylase [Firmicutes bacterium]|nr:peptide deformylase [Bacillota bacterium]
MALRNVVTQGDEILRKKSREITEITDRIKTTLEDMRETMEAQGGVGIAGPQVGVMRRMFVAKPFPDENPEDIYYMINPEIYEMEGEQEGEEGCLSVPGMQGIVIRPQRIRIKAQDINGNWQDYEFEDFAARVMCHEYDHLEGILYTDKATSVYELTDEEPEEGGEEELSQ